MNKSVVEINQRYVENLINFQIDKLFREIKEYNKILEKKDKEIKDLKDGNRVLTRAYAKKLGVFISKKSDFEVEREVLKLLKKEIRKKKVLK